jgi:response regulator NasT
MNLISKTKVQNNRIEVYGDKNTSVLLVEEQPISRSMLKKTLIDFNYYVTKHISFDEKLINEIEVNNPDILILSTEVLTDKTLKELAEINQLLPLPIVIFVEHDSPHVIQHAMKAGVSAYVIHEILPQRVKSVISVASERFKEVQSLRNELKQAKTQLESRKLIERAKGLLMEQKKISEKQAFETLRKMAMNQGNSLAMVAKNIIDVCEVLSR